MVRMYIKKAMEGHLRPLFRKISVKLQKKLNFFLSKSFISMNGGVPPYSSGHPPDEREQLKK